MRRDSERHDECTIWGLGPERGPGRGVTHLDAPDEEARLGGLAHDVPLGLPVRGRRCAHAPRYTRRKQLRATCKRLACVPASEATGKRERGDCEH